MIPLAFSPLLVFEDGPEHDTVVIFANSAAQKGPGARYCCHFCHFCFSKKARSMILLSFSQLLALDNGPEHDTVLIFATSKCQNQARVGNGPIGPSRRPQNVILAGVPEIVFSKSKKMQF
jgi:hypothetical protein